MRNKTAIDTFESEIAARAKVISETGLVKRIGDRFAVSSREIHGRSNTVEVKRDSEGVIRCGCQRYSEGIRNDESFKCEHILAVKLAIQAKTTETISMTRDSNISRDSPSYHNAAVKITASNLHDSPKQKTNVLHFTNSANRFTNDTPGELSQVSAMSAIDPVAKSLSDLITGRQLAMLREFSKQTGIDAENESYKIWNLKTNELSRSAASALIASLMNHNTSAAMQMNARRAA